MSRTIKQIYDEIIVEKQTFASLDALVPNPDTSQTFLSDLSSTSKVAVWRLLCWLMSFAIWTHEQIFDQHVIEIEQRANEIIGGTTRWYKNQALLFQLGFPLLWDGDKYVYNDTTSQNAVTAKIVTQSACTEVNNQVLLKVAKGVLGSFAGLSASEKLAFDNYIARIKYAGVDVQTISTVPDLLIIAYTIEYDPLVLDSTGLLLSDLTTYPVAVAINEYIQQLPFNSDLRIIKLTDAIQNAQGVINCICTDAQGSSNSGASYVNILITSKQIYTAYSGYMLSSGTTLNYIAG